MFVRKLGDVAHMSIEKARDLWGHFEMSKTHAGSTSTNILCPEGHAITDKKENGNVCIYNIITQNQYAFPISFSNLFAQKVSPPSQCL